MTARPYAADDCETIAARLAERRREREARYAILCDCLERVELDGSRAKVHQPGCPHYVPPCEAIAYFCEVPG